jgi:D-alanyl-lipoteichoic acid acyltransferase DltB (MBOAT superfamily)
MKNNSVIRNLITVFSIMISIAVIIFAALQIAGVWDGAINVLVPLLGLNLLSQAYTQWDKHRKVAYFSTATAIFILICSVIVFFIK